MNAAKSFTDLSNAYYLFKCKRSQGWRNWAKVSTTKKKFPKEIFYKFELVLFTTCQQFLFEFFSVCRFYLS